MATQQTGTHSSAAPTNLVGAADGNVVSGSALSQAAEVLRIVRTSGLVRGRDLAARGISPTHLQRLYEKGLLERSGRGVYFAADAPDRGNEGGASHTALGENLSLAEVCLRVPQGVICLLSALRFHNLTTQLPRAVWLALPTRAHIPTIDYPPVRVVRMGAASFAAEIETVAVGTGAPLRVYSPAKTVADCFKFRSRIGEDVALEALRDCLRKKAASVDDLWRCARVCRVANVLRPYLESVLSE
jgi:predicted transcriptional regulator of viral defense system